VVWGCVVGAGARARPRPPPLPRTAACAGGGRQVVVVFLTLRDHRGASRGGCALPHDRRGSCQRVVVSLPPSPGSRCFTVPRLLLVRVLIPTRRRVTASRARPRRGGAGGNSRRPSGWSPTYAGAPLSPAPRVVPPALPLLGWRCNAVHGRSRWRWPRSGGGAPRRVLSLHPCRWSYWCAATAGGPARRCLWGSGTSGHAQHFPLVGPSRRPRPSPPRKGGRARTATRAVRPPAAAQRDVCARALPCRTWVVKAAVVRRVACGFHEW